MKRLALVQPNSRWGGTQSWDVFPYNLCLLAAVLREKYDVEILDANVDDLSIDAAVERIKSGRYDYIGITCLAVEYSKSIRELSREIKKQLPHSLIILGGVYCTLLPEMAMEDECIDYCVLGEGEKVLEELLRCIDAHTPPERLDGVAFRTNGAATIRPQQEYISDLDALPLPAYDLVQFEKYAYVDDKFSFSNTRDAVPVAKIYASRGCPAGCNFCAVESIMGKRFRYRSCESVIKEIELLIDRYGVKEIVFYDDNLIYEKNRAKQLFRKIIERHFDLKFKAANIAVYRLDEEMIDLMKEAGFTNMVFAVESACDRVLQEIMGKPLTTKDIKSKIDYSKKLGFRCAALFVVGNPGETWDEIRRTFAFAEELDVYCHFSIATPLPKTRLYETAVAENYLTSDFDFSAYSGCSKGYILTGEFAPFDLEVLRAYEWDRINFSTPEKRRRSACFFKVSEEEVVDFARGARKYIQDVYVNDASKKLK
ncbi:MAG: radical SAM protein [Candidatus Omnitrophota bacterium]